MFEQEGDGQEVGEQDEEDDHSIERESLVALFVAKFGKKPHHKLGIDKIKQALES